MQATRSKPDSSNASLHSTHSASSRAADSSGLSEPLDFLDRLLEPGVCDVRDRLLAQGASAELTTRVVRSVLKGGVKGAWAIEAAARVLGRSFPILPSPKLRRGSGELHTFVFVGPTGGGKTASLAKLWRKLTEQGRRVMNASFDGGSAGELARIGGPEADMDRAEIPITSVRDVQGLAAGLRRARRTEICLVDTPGESPRDTDAIDRLAREIEPLTRFGALDVFLVLPATMSRSSMNLARRSLAGIKPTACVVTKLDETDRPLEVLENVERAGLPIAFLCDGADVRGHLVRPTPGRLADLGLRGRYR